MTTQLSLSGDCNNGADFSPCRTWRYALWRVWDWESHANNVMFIGLNPSTADENKDDPTIRRCINFAKAWGYGGIYMLNLYAYRATKPVDMVQFDDPVGPGNDEAFGYFRTRVGLIIAAWGSLPTRWRPRVQWKSRTSRVAELCDRTLHCLGVNSDWEPKHPLYIKGTQQPESYTQVASRDQIQAREKGNL